MDVNMKLHLESLCKRFRIELIDLLYGIQTGHPGGSLSCVEIVTTLYFDKMNNLDPKNPKFADRDRFILSKGHAVPLLYLVLAEKGFFPKEDLKNLRQAGCHLQGHPCSFKTPGIDLSSGPLGLGLSAGIGMALAARLDGLSNYTYVLLGDGEIQEGIIWEAAMSAAKFKTDHLIAILDYNGVQLDGTTEQIMPMGDLKVKWRSFGWNVLEVDGHNVREVSEGIDHAKKAADIPSILIAKTVKGKGISFMEGNSAWHGSPIGKDDYVKAIVELGGSV